MYILFKIRTSIQVVPLEFIEGVRNRNLYVRKIYFLDNFEDFAYKFFLDDFITNRP